MPILEANCGSEASLVAQLVNNPSATWETWVRSLGWEDALEKLMTTHSSTLVWKIPWIRSLVGYSSWGHKESDMTKRLHFALGAPFHGG